MAAPFRRAPSVVRVAPTVVRGWSVGCDGVRVGDSIRRRSGLVWRPFGSHPSRCIHRRRTSVRVRTRLRRDTWSSVLRGPLTDAWRLSDFEAGRYRDACAWSQRILPRELRGTAGIPGWRSLPRNSGRNGCPQPAKHRSTVVGVILRDLSHGRPQQSVSVPSGGSRISREPRPFGKPRLVRLRLRVAGNPDFTRRYAGRIKQAGTAWVTPAMGRAGA